jgi:MerR family transcriptional regulator, copper efflux regulator
MKIGSIAKKAGVGVETVRFYERKGLIAQPRKPANGFRSYPDETVAKLKFIRQAQDLGFSLKEIEELLSLKTRRSAGCADVRTRAQTKLNEVNEKVLNLMLLKQTLEELIDACPGKGSVDICSILNSMEADQKH